MAACSSLRSSVSSLIHYCPALCPGSHSNMSTFHTTFLFVTFQTIVCLHGEKCAKLTFNYLEESIMSVVENTFANVTFEIEASACKEQNMLFTITTGTRTINGSLEYDGSITSTLKGRCSATHGTSVRCVTPSGPAELYRVVNRSHVQIEWEWKWIDKVSSSFLSAKKELKLNILYPSFVTSLTVNGHEVNGSHLINEGHINISCSFDKGNQHSNFRLVDKNGKEMNYLRSEEHLNYSLTVHCKDDWPTLRCEGGGAKENRSVSFLVKCRPQFVDKHPKVIIDEAREKWVFNVRAHTTDIKSCFLTSSPLNVNSVREVNCTLTGDPPDLLLTVELEKEEDKKEGSWALSLRNEKGFSDTLVFSTHSREY